MERTVLIASEGMLLTDGEIFGTKIFLAEGRKAEEFHEIRLEDYKKLKEQEGRDNACI